MVMNENGEEMIETNEEMLRTEEPSSPTKLIMPETVALQDKKEDIHKKLMNACHDQNIVLLNALMDRYQILDEIRDEEGNSLIILATLKGNSQLVYSLCLRGLDVNHTNNEGNSALHYAVDGKYLKIIDVLLDFGADEKIENNHGFIPWQL
jgi:ankyrin repeat protein